MRLLNVSCVVALSIIASYSLSSASQQKAVDHESKKVESKSIEEAQILLIKFSPGISEQAANAFFAGTRA